jgi:hypothetical protein
LAKLTQSGVSEKDIIDTAIILEKYVAGKDRQSFISELETYGSQVGYTGIIQAN